MSHGAPTVASVLWRDFVAATYARIIVALWATTAIIAGLSRGLSGDEAATLAVGAGNLLVVSALASAVLGLIVGLRVRSVRALFATGDRLPGRLLNVRHVGATIVLDVAYNPGSGQVSVQNKLKRTASTATMRPEQPVTLAVDPRAPERALVIEAYLG